MTLKRSWARFWIRRRIARKVDYDFCGECRARIYSMLLRQADQIDQLFEIVDNFEERINSLEAVVFYDPSK